MPITAIVTAFQRVDQTLASLRAIESCQPPPDEILVYVDGNQQVCAQAIRANFPRIQVVVSKKNIGPGGARNRLIMAAAHEFIASFDDDSYPLDSDYFGRVETLMAQFPKAAILNAAIYHQNETIQQDVRCAEWVSDFIGCGCIYRRSAFLATSGYVPLRLAYCMEEVDLALRLHAQGKNILATPWLRVFHDTDLKHHVDPEVTAWSIANLVLLTYLRYPPILWIVGIGQCCKRLFWLFRNGRRRGIVSGLLMIPTHLWNNRRYRERLSIRSVRSYLELRRSPVPVSL